MFSGTERCPCIFARVWSSHEASCAAAGHDCAACRHCMANMTYWGRADEVLRSLRAAAAASSSPLPPPREEEEEEEEEGAAGQQRDAGARRGGKNPRPSVGWREGDRGR